MRLADRILSPQAPVAPSVLESLRASVSSIFRVKKTNLRFVLPDVTAVLGLLLSAGLPVGVALAWLAPRTRGDLGEILAATIANTELGADFNAELRELSEYGDPGLTELAEKLLLSLERGAGVSHQVFELAATMRQSLYRELLQKAGSNETKMLIPTIFLILPVTVLFALFPSLIVLQQSI